MVTTKRVETFPYLSVESARMHTFPSGCRTSRLRVSVGSFMSNVLAASGGSKSKLRNRHCQSLTITETRHSVTSPTWRRTLKP